MCQIRSISRSSRLRLKSRVSKQFKCSFCHSNWVFTRLTLFSQMRPWVKFSTQLLVELICQNFWTLLLVIATLRNNSPSKRRSTIAMINLSKPRIRSVKRIVKIARRTWILLAVVKSLKVSNRMSLRFLRSKSQMASFRARVRSFSPTLLRRVKSSPKAPNLTVKTANQVSNKSWK